MNPDSGPSFDAPNGRGPRSGPSSGQPSDPVPVPTVHAAGAPPATVIAVVLTYRRPRLAGDVVRSLLDREHFDPSRIIVVVNGDGGLDDPALEEAVTMIRLAENTGPAGGFRAGLEAAGANPHCQWVYLCEDDIGLFDLPTPRVADLVLRAEHAYEEHPALGAVVAYGRSFVGRGAHTVNVVPPRADLVPVDVACWGATLVARAVIDAGVLPDPALFFGVEDFDFFCQMRAGGFEVLCDGRAARAVAEQQTNEGRDAAISGHRPNDADEAWRAYYHARNSVALIRRHGRPSWLAWHAAYSARHLQAARSGSERTAIVRGLWDGVRGRLGRHPTYGRTTGEYPGGPPS